MAARQQDPMLEIIPTIFLFFLLLLSIVQWMDSGQHRELNLLMIKRMGQYLYIFGRFNKAPMYCEQQSESSSTINQMACGSLWDLSIWLNNWKVRFERELYLTGDLLIYAMCYVLFNVLLSELGGAIAELDVCGSTFR